MPIRTRLRRVWRWAASLLRRTPPASITADPAAAAATAPESPPPSVRDPRPRALRRIGASAPLAGEVVLGGCLEIRMWAVGGIVVLATSVQEAEAALRTLLSHDEPAVRRAASGLIERLRRESAIAA